MAQTESLGDVVDKRMSKSLLTYMRLVDPKCNFQFDNTLVSAWNRLALVQQRKLYLYLLYRKWRGIDIYGSPLDIINNCHPVPFNWNQSSMAGELIKENKVVVANYKGNYGTYTWDEARLYEMTDIKPFNKNN